MRIYPFSRYSESVTLVKAQLDVGARSSKLSPGTDTVIMYGNFITGFDLRLIDLG